PRAAWRRRCRAGTDRWRPWRHHRTALGVARQARTREVACCSLVIRHPRRRPGSPWTMRAAILDAPGASLTIYDDVEAEAPHAGEVAVRVSHCGICHSDLHLIDGGMPPMTPLLLGH